MNRLVIAGALGLAGPAFGQVLQLDPSAPSTVTQPDSPTTGGSAIPMPGQPIPADLRPGAAPNVIVLPPPQQTPGDGAPAEPEGLYLGGHTGPGRPEGGVVPIQHVVVAGDTLWDLCAYYYGDPWRWPEVWSLNPSITNPHWIYPGNLVRLREGEPENVHENPVDTAQTPVEAPPQSSLLRQLAFASAENLKESGVVRGSTEEKQMLSEGDDVYVDYPNGKPPQVGKRYAVYSPTKKLVHPMTKDQVGSYVLIRGEILILEVKKGKTARGRILYSTNTDPIERKDRVGPLKTQFKDIEPTPGDRNVDATVVGLLGTDQVAGQEQMVFLDRGSKDGIYPGNLLYVVRRGDAYDTKSGHYSPAGRNDPHFPDFALAQIMVIDSDAKTSVGFVTRSRQELMPGDRAVLRTAAK
jgi:LysM domain